ncbi:hypothetical protein AVEN_200784-1 [Araneus ventricosus]|uniref:Uncharacterized protein n=1 Tax=Araneus ventricosus TaxID=182803 RepID=A0A4Y2DWH3_ARAVE|nr:hypothetical protein AVEN_200784-1 [Araneus ventricosus]
MLGHPLCMHFAITKLFVDYVIHNSFAYRQFNGNFKCCHPPILPYELIHSRNRGTVGHNVRLPKVWQVLVVYASRLITLTPGLGFTVRDTALCTPLSSCDEFVKHAPFCAKKLVN